MHTSFARLSRKSKETKRKLTFSQQFLTGTCSVTSVLIIMAAIFAPFAIFVVKDLSIFYENFGVAPGPIDPKRQNINNKYYKKEFFQEASRSSCSREC